MQVIGVLEGLSGIAVRIVPPGKKACSGSITFPKTGYPLPLHNVATARETCC